MRFFGQLENLQMLICECIALDQFCSARPASRQTSARLLLSESADWWLLTTDDHWRAIQCCNGSITQSTVGATAAIDSTPAKAQRPHKLLVRAFLILDDFVLQQYTQCTKKTKQNCFCQNFVKLPPTLITFGTKMAKTTELREMHTFSTSPNLCQRTTVLNAHVQNCYITLWLRLLVPVLD